KERTCHETHRATRAGNGESGRRAVACGVGRGRRGNARDWNRGPGRVCGRGNTQGEVTEMDGGALLFVFLFIFAIFGLVTLAKGARTVRQYEKGLITRLGKFHGMAPSGLTFIV